jgi:hypothetical protein
MEKARKQIFLLNLQKEYGPANFLIWTQWNSFQASELQNFVALKVTKFVVICYISHKKLIYYYN